MVNITRKSEVQDENIDASFDEANTSNAKLSTFFREKGDQPLSEIEYEGVLSLMKKSKSTVSTPHAHKTISVPSEINTIEETKVLRSSINSLSDTPFRTPAFKPSYDGSNVSDSTSMRSSTAKRRVFDYSSLPSPYRITVYKYSVADAHKEDNRIVKPTTKLIAPQKKLSNTASALISLLDGNDSEGNNERGNDTSISELANPYSSHVSQIRKHKKPTIDSSLQTPFKSSQPTPIKSNALSEIESTKKQEDLALQQQSQQQPQQKPQQQPQQQTQQQGFDKYKPVKSSSLRVAVSVDEPLESKKNVSNQLQQQTSVPQSTSFNFSFAKPTTVEPTKPAATKPGAFAFGESSSSKKEENTQKNKTQTPLFQLNQTKSNQKNEESQESSSFSFTQKCGAHDAAMSGKPSLAFENHKEAAAGEDVIKYNFGTPAPSNVDPNTVDDSKVEAFRSMFVF